MREFRARLDASTAASEELKRDSAERTRAWRAAEPAPERIREEYEARRARLAPEVAARARPVAAWELRPGEPRVDSSHMGGAPALYPGEPWPEPDYVMRFWAQVNLADLAPFAAAYRIAMPADGLLQLFAADEGGELARYLPAADLPGLELRRDIPRGSDWSDDEEGRRIEATSRLIGFYPEALVAPSDAVADVDEVYLHSGDVPGHCFGPWPFTPPEDADALTFLAVCDSNTDLGLAYSDMGFLWACLPTADLAAGDFSRLRCEGESS
jgi:hypothetical protein